MGETHVIGHGIFGELEIVFGLQALLAKNLCQIVEGIVEFINFRLWKLIFGAFPQNVSKIQQNGTSRAICPTLNVLKFCIAVINRLKSLTFCGSWKIVNFGLLKIFTEFHVWK